MARRATAMSRLQDAAPADAPAVAAVAAPVDAKPTTPDDAAAIASEKHDPATERGLRSIESARKKLLDEQNEYKSKTAAREAELNVREAEIARLRKDAEGKVSSIDELKKLSPSELLDRLDHLTDEDFDALSRKSYARTKAGKADPRAQAAAQEADRAQTGRAAAGKVAELEAKIEEMRAEFRNELRGEFTRRDHATFAEKWVGDAVKAIPSDKPTFLSKLHANDPGAARRELLTIGGELEKADPDQRPPTQAEVIAEFEARKSAQLKALGFDPAALLAPAPTAKTQPKPAARTLDVDTPNMTRPENAPKTREERRAHAIENIRARQRSTADQQ